jgi:hypothetical protein
MKYRHKLLLDRVLARPAAFLLNCLVRPLGLLLRRSHNDEPGAVKTIVIVKIVDPGSIIRAMPMVRSLRQRCPAARIVLDTPPCRGNNQCMKSISPVDVFRRAAAALGVAPPAELPKLDRVFRETFEPQIDITVRRP